MPKTAIHTVYKTADGKRVPSVTTYLGIISKPALVPAAWKLGVQGLDYRKVWDEAATTGILVHYLILCALKNEPTELDEYSPQEVDSTDVPMEKFAEWKMQHTLEPIVMETPLVSEKYKFGGTPDFYGKDNGTLTLLDFKTSGDIYPENFYQLAAYKVLLEESGYEVDSTRIIRVSKVVDEAFEDRLAGNLENHFEIFLACQKIYELQKLVRRTRKEE